MKRKRKRKQKMALQPVTARQWEQFIRGMDIGDVGPFRQQNTVDGLDIIRTYYDLSPPRKAVSSMRVIGGVNDTGVSQLPRDFLMEPSTQQATADRYIPTQREVDHWDEREINHTETVARKESGELPMDEEYLP